MLIAAKVQARCVRILCHYYKDTVGKLKFSCCSQLQIPIAYFLQAVCPLSHPMCTCCKSNLTSPKVCQPADVCLALYWYHESIGIHPQRALVFIHMQKRECRLILSEPSCPGLWCLQSLTLGILLLVTPACHFDAINLTSCLSGQHAVPSTAHCCQCCWLCGGRIPGF